MDETKKTSTITSKSLLFVINYFCWLFSINNMTITSDPTKSLNATTTYFCC